MLTRREFKRWCIQAVFLIKQHDTSPFEECPHALQSLFFLKSLVLNLIITPSLKRRWSPGSSRSLGSSPAEAVSDVSSVFHSNLHPLRKEVWRSKGRCEATLLNKCLNYATIKHKRKSAAALQERCRCSDETDVRENLPKTVLMDFYL